MTSRTRLPTTLSPSTISSFVPGLSSSTLQRSGEGVTISSPQPSIISSDVGGTNNGNTNNSSTMNMPATITSSTISNNLSDNTSNNAVSNAMNSALMNATTNPSINPTLSNVSKTSSVSATPRNSPATSSPSSSSPLGNRSVSTGVVNRSVSQPVITEQSNNQSINEAMNAQQSNFDTPQQMSSHNSMPNVIVGSPNFSTASISPEIVSNSVSDVASTAANVIEGTAATVISPKSWGIDFNAVSIAALIIIPVIVWISLYYYSPNFICDLHHEHGRTVNTTKLLAWTIGISVAIILALWLAMSLRKGKTGLDRETQAAARPSLTRPAIMI